LDHLRRGRPSALRADVRKGFVGTFERLIFDVGAGAAFLASGAVPRFPYVLDVTPLRLGSRPVSPRAFCFAMLRW
jgi:hypothetical protein